MCNIVSLGAVVFLFSAAIASASVIRSFPHHHAARVSNIRADIPVQGGFVPYGIPNYLQPSLVQYIVNGDSKDCDHHGGIIIPQAPIYAAPPQHQPAAIVLQDKPYPPPAFLSVAVPEPPRFVEEIKPVVIPEAPVLPPLSQPELPALTVVEPAPEPCVHDVVLTPEVAPVYVPEAPVLPPFVQPELPAFIPVEQPAPYSMRSPLPQLSSFLRHPSCPLNLAMTL
ncbi:hypothetical protein JYU34_016385 [Plutella xylostella]|uniref:Uncharacterized protein n=1 Tax=Plutella xylostella TaxID=51655 RepID=A0ABQ7Q2L9_PLUXY|nr:hypothetical protein JYU34_016385 [Plutella xylostella]